MERESRNRSSSAGSEKMERVGGADREKWKDIVRQAKAHSGLWKWEEEKKKKGKKTKRE
jgi:hypothetical protein